MKDHIELVGIDPDTGVCDLEPKYTVCTHGFGLSDTDGDFAGRSELDGITDEVGQDLAHPM